MFGLGPTELIAILGIGILLFGAKKLPEIGSAFGRSIKNFKSSMKEAEAEGEIATGEQPEAAIEDAEETKEVPEIADSSNEATSETEK